MEGVSSKTGKNADRVLGVAESNSFVRSRITFTPPGTRGVPDNLIFDGDLLRGAEEYKNFAPKTWTSIKQAIDELPDKSQFVTAGVNIEGTTFKVQFFQHKNTLRDLGIDADGAEYVLKVANNVDTGVGSDVRTIVDLLEENLGVTIEVQGIPLSTKDINNFVTGFQTD